MNGPRPTPSEDGRPRISVRVEHRLSHGEAVDVMASVLALYFDTDPKAARRWVEKAGVRELRREAVASLWSHGNQGDDVHVDDEDGLVVLAERACARAYPELRAETTPEREEGDG